MSSLRRRQEDAQGAQGKADFVWHEVDIDSDSQLRREASKNPLMKARYARPSMGSREGDCQHPAKLPVRTHGSRRACRGDGAGRSPSHALNLFAGQRSAGDRKKHPAPE
jgi:hypothetical protein